MIAESGRRATVETKTGRTLVVEAAILDTAFERWYCGLTEAFDKLFDGEIVFVTGKLPGDIYACVEAFGDRYEIPQDKFVAAPQDARPQ